VEDELGFHFGRHEARARRALSQSPIEAASMLRARRFFRPVGAHGFAWKITGGHSGVRILDNFQCFIERISPGIGEAICVSVTVWLRPPAVIARPY
jgi:hypothetical protein